jgi:hypothetical protein
MRHWATESNPGKATTQRVTHTTTAGGRHGIIKGGCPHTSKGGRQHVHIKQPHTAPENIRASPRIHQRTTRKNTPMPIIMEVEEPPHTPTPTEPPTKRTATNTVSAAPRRPTKMRTVNRQRIGSKQNRSTAASWKQITSLIKQQLTLNKTMQQRLGITDKIKQKVNKNKPKFTYNVPCPKGRTPPIITQDGKELAEPPSITSRR